jgi:hypothetical protein
LLLFLSLSVVLTACTANAGLEIETGVGTELLPGESSDSQSAQNQQTISPVGIFQNPVVIGLLIILGVVLIALLFGRTNTLR